MRDLKFNLKALTDIWTGGVEGRVGKLHLTGIKGSIRWWYEVLIRGLGYYACDPTDDSKNYKCYELDVKKLKKNQFVQELICPACYMFGCTGWSGKFNLRITKTGSDTPVSSLPNSNEFSLHFIQRKSFEKEEEKLIEMTLKLIVDYGAIGGRTVFKPSEYRDKNRNTYHKDFGIIARDENSFLPTEKIRTDSVNYLGNFKRKDNHPNWPDLMNFWFVNKKCFNRRQLNLLVNRRISNGKYNDNAVSENVFLGGFTGNDKQGVACSVKKHIEGREEVTGRKTESKKIFSFHGQESGIKRCFGYTRNIDERDNIISEIKKLLDAKKEAYTIMTGKEVLSEL